MLSEERTQVYRTHYTTKEEHLQRTDLYLLVYQDEENTEPTKPIIRAVLLGDSAVGKSSLSVRYFKDEFTEVYDVTFGGIFFKKEILLGRN